MSSFSIIFLMFSIVFVIAIGIMAAVLIGAVMRSTKNKASPTLTVDAKIVAKRNEISHHQNTGDNNTFSRVATTYYLTCEVESGDRLEFAVDGKEYGLLAENDVGKLTFRGTRFIRFERKE